MKDNKGFTLVELLGVIILLGIIGLIVVPRVMNTIEDANISAYRKSVQGFIESVRNLMASDSNINFDDSIEVNQLLNNYELESQNADIFTGGYVSTDANGNVRVFNLTDGEYCANGKRNSLIVRKNANCAETYLEDVDLNDISLWEYGHYDYNNGTPAAHSSRVRTKVYLTVKENQVYSRSALPNGCGVVIRTYDENKKYLPSSSILNDNNANVKYITVIIYECKDEKGNIIKDYQIIKDLVKSNMNLVIKPK